MTTTLSILPNVAALPADSSSVSSLLADRLSLAFGVIAVVAVASIVALLHRISPKARPPPLSPPPSPPPADAPLTAITSNDSLHSETARPPPPLPTKSAMCNMDLRILSCTRPPPPPPPPHPCPPGPRGPAGPAGPAGDHGERGKDGLEGPPGPPRPALQIMWLVIFFFGLLSAAAIILAAICFSSDSCGSPSPPPSPYCPCTPGADPSTLIECGECCIKHPGCGRCTDFCRPQPSSPPSQPPYSEWTLRQPSAPRQLLTVPRAHIFEPPPPPPPPPPPSLRPHLFQVEAELLQVRGHT